MKQRDIADTARDAAGKIPDAGKDCELGLHELDQVTGGSLNNSVSQALKAIADGLSSAGRKG